VIRRADADDAQERASHRLGAAEAAARGDGIDGCGGALKQLAGGLDPDALDEARRCDAGLSKKMRRKWRSESDARFASSARR